MNDGWVLLVTGRADVWELDTVAQPPITTVLILQMTSPAQVFQEIFALV